MNVKQYPSISSSEDDSDCDEPTEIVEEKPKKPAPSERLNEVLLKVNQILKTGLASHSQKHCTSRIYMFFR